MHIRGYAVRVVFGVIENNINHYNDNLNDNINHDNHGNNDNIVVADNDNRVNNTGNY